MVGKRGGPMMKRVRWIGAHPHMVQALDHQCDGLHEHEKVEGANTALSAQYHADAIIQSYLEVVEMGDFGTHYIWDTMNVRDVKYVEMNKTEAQWRPLLQQLRQIGTESSSQFVPGPWHRSLQEDHALKLPCRLPALNLGIYQRPSGFDQA